MWNLKIELIETENGLMVDRWRVKDEGKWVKVIKRYKLSVRRFSSEDIMYSLVTVVNKALLYI